MDIFGQLGINTTAAFQFIIFCIALIFMSKVVFAPYAHALEERQKRTKGGEDLAFEFQNRSQQLQSDYENKMRELNGEIKAIVDAAKSQSAAEYESSISKVRDEAEKMVQENRTKILAAVQVAKQELQNQTGAVALSITNKLLK